jgi:hypothetical protein
MIPIKTAAVMLLMTFCGGHPLPLGNGGPKTTAFFSANARPPARTCAAKTVVRARSGHFRSSD